MVICSTGWRSKATGKSIDTPKVDVWRVRDGNIVAFFEYYDTAAVAQDAAEQPRDVSFKRGLYISRTSCQIWWSDNRAVALVP